MRSTPARPWGGKQYVMTTTRFTQREPDGLTYGSVYVTTSCASCALGSSQAANWTRLSPLG